MIFTSDLLIVSDVVYVRYLVLIFFKVNGKRTTDLFDAWLQLRRSSESPLREVLQQILKILVTAVSNIVKSLLFASMGDRMSDSECNLKKVIVVL